MADVHVTTTLLDAERRGELSREELTRIMLEHLRHLCPTCDVAITGFLADRLEGDLAQAGGGDLQELLEAIREHHEADEGPGRWVEQSLERAREEQRRARRDAAELERRVDAALAAGDRADERRGEETAPRGPAAAQSPAPEPAGSGQSASGPVDPGTARPGQNGEARRIELSEAAEAAAQAALRKVRRARTRFRGPRLASALLDQAGSSAHRRPERALALAVVAQEVAWRSRQEGTGRLGAPLGMVPAELMTRAAALQGDALRRLGDLEAAAEGFRRARDAMDAGGVTDPETLGELDLLEGTLFHAEGRLAEAESLLERAQVHWGAAGDRMGLGRTLLEIATLERRTGRLREALGTADTAAVVLPGLAPGPEPLAAHALRLELLCELEHFDQARELLEEARRLIARRESQESDAGEPAVDPELHERLARLDDRIARGLAD